MPEYVLNRNHVLRSTNGVVSFEKGKPTWVVPALEKEAVAIGAERVDGDAPDPLSEMDKPSLPTYSPEEREEQIKIAFEMLVERNESKDFTAQGVPTVKAVERIVGFEVERGEILEVWAAVKQAKAEGQ